MKIKITGDTTCDLPPIMQKKLDISIMPLRITLGDREGEDGIDVFPKDMFEYADRTGMLPKTAARGAAEYEIFFRKFLDAGYTHIIHSTMCSEWTASWAQAEIAAKKIGGGRVFVQDSRSLSASISLLLLDAKDQAEAGMPPEEIFARMNERQDNLQTSFLLDKIDYLYKGGRCSKLALLGANLLGIKPSIRTNKGKLDVDRKFRGKPVVIATKYLNDVLARFNTPDLTRCFIMHTIIDPEVVEEAIAIVSARFPFKEIIVAEAGCSITAHCGKRTICVLYFNDGDKYGIRENKQKPVITRLD